MGRIKTKKLSMTSRHTIDGLLFISPWLLGTALFFAFPLVQTIIFSFGTMVSGSSFKVHFAGIENYKRAFILDPLFVPKFYESAKQAITYLPLILVFSLFIALILNIKISFRGLFRSIFFLPVLLGTGFIMQQLLGVDVQQEVMSMARGILMPPEVASYVGEDISGIVQSFLNSLTIILWNSGVQIILFLAGLQGVSSTLYEAAYVDGATEWEKFWKITLPMLVPTIQLVIIYTLVNSFTDSSNVLVEYITEQVGLSQFEFASAIGMVYCLFVFILVTIFLAILRPFIRKTN